MYLQTLKFVGHPNKLFDDEIVLWNKKNPLLFSVSYDGKNKQINIDKNGNKRDAHTAI